MANDDPRRKPRVWQLHEAKARFSELFRRARAHGPQHVIRKGGEAVVILPVEEYERLSRRAEQPDRLVDFFGAAPTGGQDLVLERRRDSTRDLEW
jgi:antitoxin Phd